MRLLAAGLALALAGCGDGEERGAESIRTPGPTSATVPSSLGSAASSTTTAQPTTTEPAPTTEPSALLSVESLQGAMLTLADVPAGFVDAPQDEGGTNSVDYCEGRELPDSPQPIAEAEVHFKQSDLGPFILQNLGRFEDVDAATRLMAGMETTLVECPRYTETDDDGTVSVYTARPLPVEVIGDQSFGMAVTIAGGPFTFETEFVLVRRGALINVVGTLSAETVDSELTRDMVQKADEKLLAAL